MATELSVAATTATTASLGIADIPAGGEAEVQIASNPDFHGLITSRKYAATPAAVAGLNQSGCWYARARGISAEGAVDGWGETIAFYTPISGLADTSPGGILIEPAYLVVPEPIVGITATNETPGYPARNMLRDDPVMIFQSDGATTVIVARTAGSPIDLIALLETTAAEAATIRIDAGNSEAEVNGGAAPFTLAAQPFRASAGLGQRPGYHAQIRLPVPQAFPYWRLEIAGGGAAARQGRLQISYMVLGRTRSAKNISADKGEQVLDLGAIDRARDGTANRIYGHRMRKVDFEISVMSEMQWETQFGDLRWKTGLNDPVMVVPNSKAGAFLHDRILFGTVAQNRATQVNSPLFTQSFSVESLI